MKFGNEDETKKGVVRYAMRAGKVEAPFRSSSFSRTQSNVKVAAKWWRGDC
jgi:hypothetical protein